MKHLVKARDVNEAVALSLVWKNPDAMAYARQRPRFLNARNLGSLPGLGQACKIVHEERFHATEYWVWRLSQEEWVTTEEHAMEKMDILLVRDEFEAV